MGVPKPASQHRRQCLLDTHLGRGARFHNRVSQPRFHNRAIVPIAMRMRTKTPLGGASYAEGWSCSAIGLFCSLGCRCYSVDQIH
jgi:hypothetical protein